MRSIIISMCIAILLISTCPCLSPCYAHTGHTAISKPIPTKCLVVKSFRSGTALGLEIAVNEWLKDHTDIHIHCIQCFSTTLGNRILYIWYSEIKNGEIP